MVKLMDFKTWRGSDEFSARNYRWYITSCGISSRDDAEAAAENAFDAGKIEGLKQAEKLIAELALPADVGEPPLPEIYCEVLLPFVEKKEEECI
jgi:hypothetical protein